MMMDDEAARKKAIFDIVLRTIVDDALAGRSQR
jgi:hypothetical protein